jgi:hypothetical protein
VDALIRKLKLGEVITLDDLRAALARRHQVAVACPVSTAIFANMSARAAGGTHALVARAAQGRLSQPEATRRC